jgi:hypothetical protein
MTNLTIRLALLSILIVTPINAVQAIEAAPALIESSIPPEWRAPFERFLGELGTTDVEKTLNTTKAATIPRTAGSGRIEIDPERMAFRVEAVCGADNDRDQCLTIIGRIEKGDFLAEAMFLAGDHVNHSDTTPNLLGARSPTIRFYSKNIVVGVIRTAKGFLVSAAQRHESSR